MFLYHKWQELNINTRHKIAARFGIQKKGATEVFDNQIKSDGYLVKDVEEALHIDALQKYIGTNETDMMTVWIWLIDKIEGRELTQVNMDTTIPTMNPMDMVNIIKGDFEKDLVPIKPKRGRKPKQK